MTKFPDIPHENDEPVLTVHTSRQFSLPVKKSDLQELILLVENQEEITFSQVELVYVDEDEIVEINTKYLNRDYVTDIISFNYGDPSEDLTNKIEGTLYCCAPRIIEQSRDLELDVKEEFYRIFLHGLLHLAGYDDSTARQKKIMTKLENEYLDQLEL